MFQSEQIAIYEWWLEDALGADRRQPLPLFLLWALFPSSRRIEAKASDRAEDVIAKLSNDIGIFVFHLSLTQTAFIPHNRSTLCGVLLNLGVFVVNAEVTNISKAFIQESCRRLGLPTTEADPEGDPEELLIAKTNCNYGGLAEKDLDTRSLRALGLSRANCAMDANSYSIQKRCDLDPGIWSDPSIFIERFVENRGNRFFRAYWLGDYLVISEVVDPLPIKKMPEGIQRQNWFYQLHNNDIEPIGKVSQRAAHLASQIQVFVRSLRIDFGALDAVIDDDERYYIIDVNTTPSWRNTLAPEIISFLRAGIGGLLNQ